MPKLKFDQLLGSRKRDELAAYGLTQPFIEIYFENEALDSSVVSDALGVMNYASPAYRAKMVAAIQLALNDPRADFSGMQFVANDDTRFIPSNLDASGFPELKGDDEQTQAQCIQKANEQVIANLKVLQELAHQDKKWEKAIYQTPGPFKSDNKPPIAPAIAAAKKLTKDYAVAAAKAYQQENAITEPAIAAAKNELQQEFAAKQATQVTEEKASRLIHIPRRDYRELARPAPVETDLVFLRQIAEARVESYLLTMMMLASTIADNHPMRDTVLSFVVYELPLVNREELVVNVFQQEIQRAQEQMMALSIAALFGSRHSFFAITRTVDTAAELASRQHMAPIFDDLDFDLDNQTPRPSW